MIALLAAYNEGDIIELAIRHLIEQGVDVYILDDGSTDDTLRIAERYLERGVVGVERMSLPGDNDRAPFEWERILRRKEQLAAQLDADWFIHHDADEFRESPWANVLLADAIGSVAGGGFNAIDFECLEFRPTEDDGDTGDDIQTRFQYFARAQPYNRLQIRCWRKSPHVDLVSSGGHDALFEGRRVFPLRFILRHYPIRGQAHGERKVHRERRPRILPTERARGWHVHYDEWKPNASFFRDRSTLERYDPDRIRMELQIRHRDVERLETELTGLRSAHASERTTAEALRQDLLSARHNVDSGRAVTAALQVELDAARMELETERARWHGLQLDLQRAGHTSESRRRAIEALRHEVNALRSSRSWAITGPLRAAYRLLQSSTHADDGPVDTGHTATDAESWTQRLTPLSDVWGTDRGTPIDRYYIAQFLEQHRPDVRGRVLEVKDPHYTTTYGGTQVTSVDVLDCDRANPQATVIADLADAAGVVTGPFDCFILTQTLHIIYDIRTAIRNTAGLLAPGGTVLCTIPAVSRVNYENGGLESGDFWRLTAAAARRLFEEHFEPGSVEVVTRGNVRVCAAFLYGLASEELDPEDLSYTDPWFPLLHCIRAVRGRGADPE